MDTHPFLLTNQQILVTGASSGIGRQTAISISQMGAKVILTARNEERLLDTFQQLAGSGHQYFLADLTKAVDLTTLIKQLPKLDGIVHSAGIVKPLPVKFLTEKHIEQVQQINYKAPVLLTSRLLRTKKLASQASIVFISSFSSQFPYIGGATYTGCKAALEAYSKTVALEYAHQNIRSNCICPAMVQTPIFQATVDMVSQEAMDKYEQKYLLGFGEPIDVANAAIFLLSNASKWITGTNLCLDGGLTISSQW